jgi:hypothetical protein
LLQAGYCSDSPEPISSGGEFPMLTAMFPMKFIVKDRLGSNLAASESGRPMPDVLQQRVED